MGTARSTAPRQTELSSSGQRRETRSALRAYPAPSIGTESRTHSGARLDSRETQPPIVLRMPDVSSVELPWRRKLLCALGEHKLDVALAIGAIVAAALLFLPHRSPQADEAPQAPAWSSGANLKPDSDARDTTRRDGRPTSDVDPNTVPIHPSEDSIVPTRERSDLDPSFSHPMPLGGPDAEAAQKSLLPSWKNDAGPQNHQPGDGLRSGAPPNGESSNPAGEQQQPVRTRTVQSKTHVPIAGVRREPFSPAAPSGAALVRFEGIITPTAYRYDSSRPRFH